MYANYFKETKNHLRLMNYHFNCKFMTDVVDFAARFLQIRQKVKIKKNGFVVYLGLLF